MTSGERGFVEKKTLDYATPEPQPGNGISRSVLPSLCVLPLLVSLYLDRATLIHISCLLTFGGLIFSLAGLSANITKRAAGAWMVSLGINAIGSYIAWHLLFR
jgi:hypothetical protein